MRWDCPDDLIFGLSFDNGRYSSLLGFGGIYRHILYFGCASSTRKSTLPDHRSGIFDDSIQSRYCLQVKLDFSYCKCFGGYVPVSFHSKTNLKLPR